MSELKTEILLCDDEANLVAVLVDYLKSKGYSVTAAQNAEDAFNIIKSKNIDICILDAKMPGMNGIEFLENLRKSGETLPVIVMGDHLAQSDIIKAYMAGCDAYVEKPLAVELLICKINAIMRRCKEQKNSKEKVFDLNGKIFDGEHHSFDGQHLSARENDLLLLLCQNMGDLVDRHLILRALWREDNYFASRSLSVYVNRLRHILTGSDMRIIAVNKRGYKIVNSKE